MVKGILRISVDGEDEEAVLELLWEIINNISREPDLMNDYVQLLFKHDEELEEFEEYTESESFED